MRNYFSYIFIQRKMQEKLNNELKILTVTIMTIFAFRHSGFCEPEFLRQR